VRADPVGVVDARPGLGVDAVVHHVHLRGVGLRVGAQHVVAHRRRHRDHRGRTEVRRALGEGRDGVPAAELFGLPRPQRLQRVRGDHVGDVVQQPGEVAAEVGVPGVRVHQVRPLAPVGDRQVDAERLERGVGVAELEQVGVRRHPGLVARPAERLHLHLEAVEASQRAHQLRHMHPRTAVDGRRVLLGQDVDAHGCDATQVAGSMTTVGA
jgi:hypothetical protein